MLDKKPNRVKGFFAGAAGGLAGFFVLQLYWKGVEAFSSKELMAYREHCCAKSKDVLGNLSLIGKHHRPGEAPLQAMGRNLYTIFTGQEPPSDDIPKALRWVLQISSCMLFGGIFGARRGRVKTPDLLGGALLGSQVWLLGDELLMPLLGLADGPPAYPWPVHVHALAGHLSYGLTTATAAQLFQGKR